MNKLNGKRFSVYTSDEKTALGLIKELGEQTNYNSDEIERLTQSDNKKVSHQEMQELYKIDKQANFTGSWFGIKRPTQSDVGLSGTVEQLIDETIPGIKSQLETKANDKTVRFKDKLYLDKIFNHFPNDKTNRLQGYCIVGDNIIFSLINSEETKAYLYKYNLLDDSISNPKTFANLKHSNDMCYVADENAIYIVIDGGIEVAKINATTLDYIGNVSFPIGVGAIGFDNTLNLFVVRNYLDEKFYIINRELEITSSFYHARKLTEQGLCINNGLIYMTYFEAGSDSYGQVEYNSVSKDCNYINVFDLKGNLVKTWNIGKFGELEGIDFNGDYAILGINSCYGLRVEFYKCQFKDNLIQPKLTTSLVEEIGQILYTALPYNIYVDKSVKGIGNGTIDRPFSSLKEAIRFIYNCKNNTYFNLSLKGDFTSEKNIYITGLSKKIFIDGNNLTTIDSITFDSCKFVRLSNIVINNVSGDKNAIYLDCSTLDLRNCTLNNSKNVSNAIGIKGYCGNLILGSAKNNISNFNKAVSMWQGEMLYSNAQTFSNNTMDISLDGTICKCDSSLIPTITSNNTDYMLGNNVVYGNTSMQCTTPNVSVTKDITIPKAKAILFASVNVGTSNPQHVHACVNSISGTTFTIAFNRPDTVETGVTWMAVVKY